MKIGHCSQSAALANQLLLAAGITKTMPVAVSLPVIPGKTSAKINQTQDC